MFVTPAYAQEQAHQAHESTAAAHGSAGTEVAHEGAFPPFNAELYPSQLLWLAITFGAFFYILSKTILPQIGATLGHRRGRIVGDIEAAEHMRADADAARGAYEQELAQARQRSHAIAAQAREASKTDADAERRRTEGDLDAKLQAAQARIGEIKRQALGEVGQIAEDVTQSILADVAGIEVSREEAAAAVSGVRR